MAIAITNLLEEGDTTGGDPVTTTGSISVVSGRSYLFTVLSSTTPTVSSITPPGSFSSLAVVLGITRGTTFRHEVWAGLCDGSGNGTVQIDFSGATTGTITCVDEITGADGAGLVVQFDDNNLGNSATIAATLAAFADATNNAAWMSVGTNDNTANDITEEATFTELGYGSHATPARSLLTAWRTGEDTSPSASFGAARQCTIIALEIEMAAVGGGTKPKTLLTLGVG